MTQPLVVSCGLGVDSLAMLVGLYRLGIRPGLVMFAHTLGEKDETYAYIPILREWLYRVGFPDLTEVKYQVKDYKNWPPYDGLEENCLTNGTLPSEAFGFGSCSIKWKQAPQHAYLKGWQPAQECWAAGGRVRRAIGYDASPKDQKRACSTFKVDATDPRYEYWYPLQEWGWDRPRCEWEISMEGLPVPVKSSCFYCPNMKPAEVMALPREKLARIVIMEARAKPRLRAIEGLWRNGCKGTRGGEKKPGSMTQFINENRLLPSTVITRLISQVPKELINRNEAHARGEEVETWPKFMERVLAGV